MFRILGQDYGDILKKMLSDIELAQATVSGTGKKIYELDCEISCSRSPYCQRKRWKLHSSMAKSSGRRYTVENRAKTVREIQPTRPSANAERSARPLRVAAYCRVSTDSDEQEMSFDAQCKYYTDRIMTNPKWTLAGIFADEGISGTNAGRRKEFMKMIRFRILLGVYILVSAISVYDTVHSKKAFMVKVLTKKSNAYETKVREEKLEEYRELFEKQDSVAEENVEDFVSV